MFLETPAAMKYQVEEHREEILFLTDDIKEYQLQKLLLTRYEISLLAPKVQNLYISLLECEADLNMVINFNIKFKTGAKI